MISEKYCFVRLFRESSTEKAYSQENSWVSFEQKKCAWETGNEFLLMTMPNEQIVTMPFNVSCNFDCNWISVVRILCTLNCGQPPSAICSITTKYRFSLTCYPPTAHTQEVECELMWIMGLYACSTLHHPITLRIHSSFVRPHARTPIQNLMRSSAWHAQ